MTEAIADMIRKSDEVINFRSKLITIIASIMNFKHRNFGLQSLGSII